MRAKADELDKRAMSGEGTEDDALESFRLVWPGYFNDPATAPAMPDDIRLSVPGYSQTFEDILALLADGRPAEPRRGVRPDRWRSSTASAARSRSRPPSRPRRRSRRGSATGVPDAGHFTWLEQPGCVADGLVRLGSHL